MSPEIDGRNEQLRLAEQSYDWYRELGQTADLSGLQDELARRGLQMIEGGNRKHVLYGADMLCEAARLVDDRDLAVQLQDEARAVFESIINDGNRNFDDIIAAYMGIENIDTQRLYDDFHKYKVTKPLKFVGQVLQLQMNSAQNFLRVMEQNQGATDYSSGKMFEWSEVIRHRREAIQEKDLFILIRSSFLREDRAGNVQDVPEGMDVRSFNFDIAKEKLIDGKWQLIEGGRYAVSDHEKEHGYAKGITVMTVDIPSRLHDKFLVALMHSCVAEVKYEQTGDERFLPNAVDKGLARQYQDLLVPTVR